jgi:hypothetical protein
MFRQRNYAESGRVDFTGTIEGRDSLLFHLSRVEDAYLH